MTFDSEQLAVRYTDGLELRSLVSTQHFGACRGGPMTVSIGSLQHLAKVGLSLAYRFVVFVVVALYSVDMDCPTSSVAPNPDYLRRVPEPSPALPQSYPPVVPHYTPKSWVSTWLRRDSKMVDR